MTARRLAGPHLFWPLLVTTTGLAILLGLGFWQVERGAWKRDLIATLSDRLTRAPEDLPPVSQWGRLRQADAEFRRVKFRATLLAGDEALVYTVGSALRADVSGPGYWVFSRARLADGSLVAINRGFIPEAEVKNKRAPDGAPAGAQEFIGVLRWPEASGLFTPADNPARNLWFRRDHAAMAAAKGWGPVAPFYVDIESPASGAGHPRPGPLSVRLPNNHFQYALTWFGLAAVLAGIFLLFVRNRKRSG